MARTPTRRRTRRTRRRKLTLADHLLYAGVAGGGLYLFTLHVLSMPASIAVVVGLICFGFTLGTWVPVPRYRSPIVWRRR